MRRRILVAVAIAVVALVAIGAYGLHWAGKVFGSIDEMQREWYA